MFFQDAKRANDWWGRTAKPRRSVARQSSRVSAPDFCDHATTRVFCRGHVCTQALTGLTGETRTRRFARSTTRAGATRRGDPPGPRGRGRSSAHLEGPFHGRGDRARRVRVGPSRPGAGRNDAPRPPASPRARAARAGRFARVFCGKTTHQVSVVCRLSALFTL